MLFIFQRLALVFLFSSFVFSCFALCRFSLLKCHAQSFVFSFIIQKPMLFLLHFCQCFCWKVYLISLQPPASVAVIAQQSAQFLFLTSTLTTSDHYCQHHCMLNDCDSVLKFNEYKPLVFFILMVQNVSPRSCTQW